MQDLKVTLVQTPLYWEDKSANLAMLEEQLFNYEEETDLIVLPEMFNTGFSMSAEKLAEPMNLHTFKWMKQMATQKKVVVTGSYIVKEDGKYFNRLIWMQPDGNYTTYDKRHLFRMADEHHHFNMGQESPIVELKGWKIKPLICYDLRFPVWSRNTSKNDTMAYDLLLYVANWPAARVNAWDALLKARAIENLSYCLGVNRIGDDGNGVPFNGHSGAYNFKGETICFLDQAEMIKTITLSYEDLKRGREKFPAYLDADDFNVL
ncbi:amidohydrolase [Marivirga atlantica]|jgi:predicted amidohydrolase|uniref:Omega-amidase YafV n=1 Tax=Marivirga atlantica TaxID=1548457 RepID=A0A937DIZ6_9BACT|nr:amidohydrolase [Marivirga atlantica]MBL0764691.1 amidohydrolase [Marivirga atlantica]